MNVAFHPDERALAFNRELVTWAKRYAARGIPVFPVMLRLVDGKEIKRPCVKWKEGATTNPDQIERWWRYWPLAMIGAPTGSRSGINVIDVDTKDGRDGFLTLKKNGWSIPPSAPEIITPSGGSHFYFRVSADRVARNSSDGIGLGIDIRGEGGMVILPPSRPRLDGPDYHFREGRAEEIERWLFDGIS